VGHNEEDARILTPAVCTIAFEPDGQLVILYPDGMRNNTGIYPSVEERRLAEAFCGTTAGLTLLMHLRRREIYDPLTGLLLREPALDLIRHRLRGNSAKGYTGTVAVLCLDLDHFGILNKRYGQVAGDQVLIWFANILTRMTRGADISARWGGEEFTVFATAFQKQEEDTVVEQDGHGRDRDRRITTDLGTTTGQNIGDVLQNGLRIARRIWKATRSAPCIVGGQAISQTVTVGVATAVVSPDSDVDGLFDSLFDKADSELRIGKTSDKRDEVHAAKLSVCPSV